LIFLSILIFFPTNILQKNVTPNTTFMSWKLYGHHQNAYLIAIAKALIIIL